MSKAESNSRRDSEWLDLRGLTNYASVSERTIRQWLHRGRDPLPAVQVGRKILVRRTVFDRWLDQHPLQPAESIEISGIVNEIMSELSKAN